MNQKDTEYKEMHSLTGAFIKEELEEVFEKKQVLCPFSLCYLQRKETLYAANKEDRARWVKALKTAIGYASLSDYYEMKVLAALKARPNWATASSGR